MFDTLEKILLVGSKDKRKDTVASCPQPHFPELAVHKNVKIRSHLERKGHTQAEMLMAFASVYNLISILHCLPFIALSTLKTVQVLRICIHQQTLCKSCF